MAQQQLLYNKTLTISKDETLLVQVWSPTEVTLKHVRKQADGSLGTLAVFRVPLEMVTFTAEALIEAQKEVTTLQMIRKALLELFHEFPREKIEQVFQRVMAARLGMPGAASDE